MRSARALLLAVALAVVASGCSATIPGSPAPARPSGATAAADRSAAATGAAIPANQQAVDPTAWTSRLCDAVQPFIAVAHTPAAIDRSSTTAASKSLARYYGQTIDGIDRSLTAIHAMGPAPLAEMSKEVPVFTTSLTALKSVLSGAKTTIDAAASSDPHVLDAVTTKAYNHVEDTLPTLRNPLSEFVHNPALAASAKRAPGCQKIVAAL